MAALSEPEEKIDDNFIRKSIDLALKKAVQEEMQAEEIGVNEQFCKELRI